MAPACGLVGSVWVRADRAPILNSEGSMTSVEVADLTTYCRQVANQARAAGKQMAVLGGDIKNRWLNETATRIEKSTHQIQEANALDIDAAPSFGLTDAQVDRLRLDEQRIAGITSGLREIAMLADPIGESIESCRRPNGLQVTKLRVPLGVVFFIYESRPNVTADAAAICVKSGNAVILRGGKEAAHSNRVIVDIMQHVAQETNLPDHAVQLVATSDRAAVGEFLTMPQLIDVAIPRGGEGLIRRVVREAMMPVIKHFSGNCHVYVHRDADVDMAESIVVNSKCQRMGVCNACESMLVHREIANDFVPRIAKTLTGYGIEIRGDSRTCELVEVAIAASEEDFSAEFLGPIISVCIVESLDEAIQHINQYGTHHTDAIVTTTLDAANHFTRQVDSAAVMVNTSTRFNDGNALGLGAEIGISTDKFHARGPCGLKELTSYKYIVEGCGQIR
jgi:glutamate-5-semialdehyde dehydrogenase